MPVPRPEHPRPDRRRERWWTLNGEWDFSFGEPTFDRRIAVPFPYQARASGIADTGHHPVLWYRRSFEAPTLAPHERLLLHFGAVDFEAEVWVNDVEVGRHRGGHTSFTCDATPAIDRDRLIRRGHGASSGRVPERPGAGKQTATFPYLVHYTPTSGIWQPVWVEVTGERWIDELQVVAEADGLLRLDALVSRPGLGDQLRATVRDEGEILATAAGTGPLELGIAGARPWSPDSPTLYDLEVELVAPDSTVLGPGPVVGGVPHADSGRRPLGAER